MAGVPMTFAREEIPTAEAEQYGTPDAEAPTHEHDHSAHDFAELRRQGLAGIDPAAHSRHAVFRKPDQNGEGQATEVMELDGELTWAQLDTLVEQALQTPDQDCEGLLNRVSERLERVNVKRPTVEIRFQDLHAETTVYLDQSRNIPNLLNAIREPFTWATSLFRRNDGATTKLVILDSISGVLKPGRITLLLGPPSSGKTTLLKALSGRLEHSGLQVGGGVTYNGRSFQDFRVHRTAGYIEQEDVHMGELTVRETFDFAARCMGAGTKKDDLHALRELEKQMDIEPDWSTHAYMRGETVENRKRSVLTAFVIRMLGLGICADTEVGNAMRRGVSGGQKKRVTTGEQMVGPKRVVFADEISTGLDSSTTYQIIKWMRDTCHTQLDTMLIALLQPAPETWELFDDVLLIAEGHVVYHGPIQQTLDFFSTMGFQCPERKGVADFLQEVTSRNDQQQYHSKEWQEPYRYISCKEMSDNFKESPVGKRMHDQLAQPLSPEYQQENERALVKSKFALSAMNMFRACMDREVLLVQRNLFLYGFRTVQTIIIAVCVVLTFFHSRMPTNSQSDGGKFFSVLFFSLLIIMFDGITELNLTVERLPGFYRQRDNRMYSTLSFITPVTLLRLPYSFAIALVWSAMVYYPCNLAPEASRFFTFLLLLFLLHNMGISMFRAISSATRNEVSSLIVGCFFFLALLLLGGFLLPRYQTPIWVKWVVYINPVWYVQSALALNEFKAPRWQDRLTTDPAYPGKTVGDATVLGRGIIPHSYVIWLAVGVLIFANVLFNLQTWLESAYLSGLGRRNTGLPPHLLEAASRRKLAREGPGKNHDSADQAPAHAQSNGKIPAKHDILDTQPDLNVHGSAGHGIMDSHTNYNNAPNQGGMLDSHTTFMDSNKPSSAVAGANGGTDGDNGRRKSRSGKGGVLSSFRRKSSDTSARGGGDRLASFRAAQQSRNSLDAQRQSGPSSSKKVMGTSEKGMVLPFQPLSLTFHHMDYYVKLPKAMDTTDPEKQGPKAAEVDGTTMLQLLKDCSGVFRPGILTALVGSSGAGKTTLMDVLAGRKTGGKVVGEVTVGGFPKNQETFARVSGYVEQTDVHSPLTTVHEALMFSAKLRLTDVTDKDTLEAFVNEVEELVELKTINNSLVGIPGSSGLSVEQRKRLTIGVELVANPSIVFMDEPTSGLDARAAAIVMRAVRNTVNTGRLVVCTIHQPSIDIFEAFDDLLLMKIGGRIIYHGELGRQSSKLVAYFEGIAGVPKLTEGLNPATWMLQISTPGMERSIGVNFADIFAHSAMDKHNEALIEQESQPKEGAQPLSFHKQYARTTFVQFVELLKRDYSQYWRNVPYNGTRFAFSGVIGAIIGCILWSIGDRRDTVQDFADILGALYLSVLFLGIINAMSVQSVVFFQRSVLYREYAAGTYSKMPFALSLCCVEIPYNTLEAALFSVVSYFMVHFIFDAGKFFWYMFFIWLILNLMTFYGIFGVFMTPDLPAASVLSAMSYGLWNLTAGFIAPWSVMPWWIRWFWYINPVSWGLYGIIVTQMGDLDQNIALTDGGTQSIRDYLYDNYHYEYSFRWPVVGILLAFAVTFATLTVIGIKAFNFQTR